MRGHAATDPAGPAVHLRLAGAGGNAGHTRGLATAQCNHVELVDFVIATLGFEQDAAAIG